MTVKHDHTRIEDTRITCQSHFRGQVVLLLAGLLLISSISVEATIPTSEREALIALYDGTSGPSWYYPFGWLGPEGTECMWEGVSCDAAETTVVELFLRDNALSGSLPPEIGDLTGLVSLDLSENPSIGGPIPDEIGNLINLEILDIGSTYLTGTLPSGIAGLGSLKHLDVSSSNLSGPVSPVIGSLHALEHLNLSWNQLTGMIPVELASLTALRELFLGGNQLSGPIPHELGNLPALEMLNLGSNQLSGPIPPEFGGLSALEILDLAYNRIAGAIPSTLGDLQSLTALYLRGNELTGSIPLELMSIPTLETLNLSTNRLGGELPSSLGSGPNIQTLWLSRNKFEGEIPPSLATFCDNGGSLFLGENALYTDDPTLAAQLDACNGYWKPQGDAPTNLEILDLEAHSATVGWTPIYWQFSGVYEVLLSPTSGGPYERIASTALLADKGIDRVAIGPLEPNTTYHAVVRSVTYPIAENWTPNNRNTVVSRPSAEFVFITPPADTYHVSISGNDQSDCLSPAAPCRTIQAAIDRAVSGDAVVVGPGRFEENLTIDRSLALRGSTTPATIIDGSEADSTVFVADDTIVTLQRLQINNGLAPYGGGVFNNGAVLFILETEIAGNHAIFDGGGIFNDSGLIVVEASAVIENTAGSDALVASGVDPVGNAIVGFRNSTLSGNTSTDLFSRILGPSHLMNCTVAANQAGLFGFVLEGSGSRAQHTIFAGNQSPACNGYGFVSRGYNVADHNTCFSAADWINDLIVADAGLGPLDDHGGPTKTHELLPGSPAIDAGDNDGAPIPDQRGVNRPVDGNGDGLSVVDIGALETSGEPAIVFHDDFETGDTSRWSISGT